MTLPTPYDTYREHDGDDGPEQEHRSEEVTEFPDIKGTDISQHERVPHEESVAQ